MSDNPPSQVTSDLDLLHAELSVDLDHADLEEDAFQTASPEDLDAYVTRLREIARAGEKALARGDS